MISDAEQRRLAEIEVALRRDDPDFVRHFDKRSFVPRRRHVRAILAFLIVSAAITVAWVLGGAGMTLIPLSVIVSIAISFGVWRSQAHGQRNQLGAPPSE